MSDSSSSSSDESVVDILEGVRSFSANHKKLAVAIKIYRFVVVAAKSISARALNGMRGVESGSHPIPSIDQRSAIKEVYGLDSDASVASFLDLWNMPPEAIVTSRMPAGDVPTTILRRWLHKLGGDSECDPADLIVALEARRTVDSAGTSNKREGDTSGGGDTKRVTFDPIGTDVPQSVQDLTRERVLHSCPHLNGDQTRLVSSNSAWGQRLELLLEGEPQQGNVIVALSGEGAIVGVYQVFDRGVVDATKPGRAYSYPVVPVWGATANGIQFLLEKYPRLFWQTERVAVDASADFFASPPNNKAPVDPGSFSSAAVISQMQKGFEAAFKDSSEMSQAARDRQAKVANFDVLVEFSAKGENAGQFVKILTKAGNIDHQGLAGNVLGAVDPTYHSLPVLRLACIPFLLNFLFGSVFNENPKNVGGLHLRHFLPEGMGIDSVATLRLAVENIGLVCDAVFVSAGLGGTRKRFISALLEPMMLRLAMSESHDGLAALPVDFLVFLVTRSLKSASDTLSDLQVVSEGVVPRAKAWLALQLALTLPLKKDFGGDYITWSSSHISSTSCLAVPSVGGRGVGGGGAVPKKSFSNSVSIPKGKHGSGMSKGNSNAELGLCKFQLPFHLKIKDAAPCRKGDVCVFSHSFEGRSKADLKTVTKLWNGPMLASISSAIDKS